MKTNAPTWITGESISAPTSANPRSCRTAAQQRKTAPRESEKLASGKAKLNSSVRPSGFAICSAAVTPAPSAVITPTRAARRQRPGAGASSANSVIHRVFIIAASDQTSSYRGWSPARRCLRLIALVCAPLVFVCMDGCAARGERPELSPSRFALPELRITNGSPGRMNGP